MIHARELEQASYNHVIAPHMEAWQNQLTEYVMYEHLVN